MINSCDYDEYIQKCIHSIYYNNSIELAEVLYRKHTI